MQKLVLIGNLGSDAVIRATQGDNVAISFNVAHTERYKDKEEVQHEKATWWDCVLWRKKDQSTNIAKYLKKGTKVYIEGNPYAETFINNKGETKAALKCNVNHIELLSAAPKETSNVTENVTATEPINDDLPF